MSVKDKTTEWLYFSYVTTKNKTHTVEVKNAKSRCLLGTIKWYGAWRQYCFFSEPDIVFSSGCLEDIQNHIRQLMDERSVINAKARARA